MKGQPLIPEFKDLPTWIYFWQLHYRGHNTELPSEDEKQHESEQKRVRKTFKYGIQWKPEEFFEQAKAVLHPKDPQKALPQVLKEAVILILNLGGSRNSTKQIEGHRSKLMANQWLQHSDFLNLDGMIRTQINSEIHTLELKFECRMSPKMWMEHMGFEGQKQTKWNYDSKFPSMMNKIQIVKRSRPIHREMEIEVKCHKEGSISSQKRPL